MLKVIKLLPLYFSMSEGLGTMIVIGSISLNEGMIVVEEEDVEVEGIDGSLPISIQNSINF